MTDNGFYVSHMSAVFPYSVIISMGVNQHVIIKVRDTSFLT